MKTAIKLLFSALALGLAASTPLLRAADETAPPVGRQRAAKGGVRGGGGAALNGDQRVAQLDRELTLTEDQKAKIKEIYGAAQKEVQGLAPADRRTKGVDILQSTRTQVRAVLTEDQQKKFDQMPADRRGGAGGGQNRRKKGN